MSDLQIIESTIFEYFKASNTKNETKLLALFADDATVVDEGKTHTGIAEIQSWRNKVNSIYDVRFEIIGESSNEDGTIVEAKCSGNFPGSPLVIKHFFVLLGQKISHLKIV